MQPSLIYVDDEQENLNVFKRVFKRDFLVYTALSGEEGLDLFEAHPEVSLLVSDQRMPGMSGVDFLNACKHINPLPIRILITGYADLESTIHAINDAEVYRFIKKPWERLDLQQTLLEGQKKFCLEQELIQKNRELQSLDRLKNNFMLLVNHELKTPLTVQRSYLEFLKESTSLGKDEQLYVQKSLDGSQRLEFLIEEILLFLKVQKGEGLVKEEVFSLDAMGIQLKTDQTLFMAALNRLIQNAQVHKKEGSKHKVFLEGNLLVVQNQNSQPNVDLNLVLKPFEIHEEAFHHSKGLGMGLSVASLILNKLGFPLELSSGKDFVVKIDLSKHQVRTPS